MSLPDAPWFSVVERWIFLALMLLAGLAWGLKLESRIDSVLQSLHLVENRLSEMDKTINRGILPLTDERLRRIAAEVASVEEGLAEVRNQCEEAYAKSLRREKGQ